MINERFKNTTVYSNADMTQQQFEKFCKPDKNGGKLLKNAFEKPIEGEIK